MTGPYGITKKKKKEDDGRLDIFYDFLRVFAAQVTSSHALNKLDSPLKGPELLRVAHDFAEVYMKHVSTVFQHDVVVVAVTDPQHKCGHTPAGTRVDEVHNSLEIYWEKKVT